ncbi:MAG: GntR family transcriptional regulator [Hyphomicrobiaceae bacterium]
MPRASDTAYTHIKSWIQSGEIAPGDQIDDVRIAAQLGTSRTPIREALLRLQNEGFVLIERGKGVRVRRVVQRRDARDLPSHLGT